MKSSLKFSVAAAVALTSVVPNLALAGNRYDIDVASSGATYSGDNGTFSGVVSGDFDNGELRENSGNTIIIDSSNGVHNSYKYNFYGGFISFNVAGSQQDTDVENNKVEIDNRMLIIGSLVGGMTQTRSSNSNIVTVNRGYVEDVIGGQIIRAGSTSKASNNEVHINSSAAVSGDVYGAYMGGAGTASGNKVFISGGNINGNVYATRTAGNSTDNTVTITGGRIKGELGANEVTANSLMRNTLNIDRKSVV